MYRQSEKNLLNSNISSTCSHNMVNFGPLADEIGVPVSGTQANFKGFRVLASFNAKFHYAIWFEAGRRPASNQFRTRMWANAQPDGRPAEHRWRPLFNAAKFG